MSKLNVRKINEIYGIFCTYFLDKDFTSECMEALKNGKEVYEISTAHDNAVIGFIIDRTYQGENLAIHLMNNQSKTVYN